MWQIDRADIVRTMVLRKNQMIQLREMKRDAPIFYSQTDATALSARPPIIIQQTN